MKIKKAELRKIICEELSNLTIKIASILLYASRAVSPVPKGVAVSGIA